MIFRSGVFSRRAGLSESQFNQHWQEVHGALASKMPGVHRYLQNHIRERLYEVTPFPDHPIGGISQQWFDDIEAMERCERSPEYAAVKRDIPNFQGAITILVLEGLPLFDIPAPGGAKLLVLSRAREPHLTLGAPGWRDALQLQDAAPDFRCVQNLVVDRGHPVSANVPSGQVPIDAMAELWFEDESARQAWLSSDAGQRFVHEHPLLTPLAVYAVEEIRIV
jgi:uncharacterized protein (TIGR02118 family)